MPTSETVQKIHAYSIYIYICIYMCMHVNIHLYIDTCKTFSCKRSVPFFCSCESCRSISPAPNVLIGWDLWGYQPPRSPRHRPHFFDQLFVCVCIMTFNIVVVTNKNRLHAFGLSPVVSESYQKKYFLVSFYLCGLKVRVFPCLVNAWAENGRRLMI